MSDAIMEIRLALRSLFLEDVEPQAIITMAAYPGERSQYESRLRIVGYDRAMSREATGFGTEEDPEVGKWTVMGLPERSETGRANPAPWILFMDWMWGFLRSAGLNPVPVEGFGELSKKYGKLSVHQKRVRKYGGGIAGQYDVKRDVTIAIESIGNTVEETTRKLGELFKQSPTPEWFYVSPDMNNYRFHIVVDIDVDTPEGWRERLGRVTAYKRENREKWSQAIKNLAAGRTNPVQLAPLVISYLVDRHDFKRPFHVDVLDAEEFNRAIGVIGQTKLSDIVSYASETGQAPPVVGKPPEKTRGSKEMLELWAREVTRLAQEGNVDPYVVQVAMSEYMAQQRGFSEPFDIELLSPAALARAVSIARRLSFEDITGFTESIKRDIERLIG